MSPTAAESSAPRVAALVLAAGRSSRMAPHNKLLLQDQAGLTMVARVAAACVASRAAHVAVVTGYQAPQVRQAVQAVAGNGVSVTHAPDFESGLSASLGAGVRALPAWVDGVIVCLGDMPLVGAGMIDRIIAAFVPAAGQAIVVPTWQGARGNPVLWGRALFGELCRLSGDTGARHLLADHQDLVTAVEADGPAVLTDYDTQAVLPGCWHAAAGPRS